MIDLLSNIVFDRTSDLDFSFSLRSGYYCLQTLLGRNEVHKIVSLDYNQEKDTIPWVECRDKVDAVRLIRWFALSVEKDIHPQDTRDWTFLVLWQPLETANPHPSDSAVAIAPFIAPSMVPPEYPSVPYWFREAEQVLGPIKDQPTSLPRVSRYERGEII